MSSNPEAKDPILNSEAEDAVAEQIKKAKEYFASKKTNENPAPVANTAPTVETTPPPFVNPEGKEDKPFSFQDYFQGRIKHAQELLKADAEELKRLKEEGKNKKEINKFEKKVEKTGPEAIKRYEGILEKLGAGDTEAVKKWAERAKSKNPDEIKKIENQKGNKGKSRDELKVENKYYTETIDEYDSALQILGELEKSVKPTVGTKDKNKLETENNLDIDFSSQSVDTGFLNAETLGLNESSENTAVIVNPDVVAVEDTESVLEKKNPIKKWNELNAEKEKIIKELSGDLPIESRKVLENKIKEESLQMIEQGCKVSGKDFEEEKKAMEAEKEKQWEVSILSASGAKNIEEYKAQQKKASENPHIVNFWAENVIKDNATASTPEQKETLFKKGEIGIGGRIILEKEDVAVLIKSGIDITKVKRKWLGFGVDFTIGEKYFGNVNQLNKFIAEEKERHLREDFEKKYEEKKKQDIEQHIEQYILDQKLKAVHNSFISKESRDVVEGFQGKFETEDQMKEALLKMQQEEDKYRVLAENIDKTKSKKNKAKLMEEFDAKKEDHKKLAHTMLELACMISGTDIKTEAKKKNPNSIGSEIYKIIKEMTEGFKTKQEI